MGAFAMSFVDIAGANPSDCRMQISGTMTKVDAPKHIGPLLVDAIQERTLHTFDRGI
jgi:hypothetical protein